MIASLPKKKNEAAQSPITGKQVPILQALIDSPAPPADGRHTKGHNSSVIFEAQDQSWYGSIVDINNNGNQYQLVIATPAAYLTAEANAIRNRSTLIAFILLMLSLPIIWYFSLRISKPLIRLRQDADAISHLHFEENELEHSAIEEVDELHKSMSKMKLTLKQLFQWAIC